MTEASPAFPSGEDRAALRHLLETAGWNLERAFTEQERWCWHAYDYGWRRAQLGDYRRFSPIDPDKGDGSGEWFDAGYAAETERFWRKKLGRLLPAKLASPGSQETVRPDWRSITAHDLTEAEHRLADPEIARMAQEAADNIARIKHIPRERGDQHPPPKAPPPPPLAAPDDPGVQEWMRRMGELDDPLRP